MSMIILAYYNGPKMKDRKFLRCAEDALWIGNECMRYLFISFSIRLSSSSLVGRRGEICSDGNWCHRSLKHVYLWAREAWEPPNAVRRSLSAGLVDKLVGLKFYTSLSCFVAEGSSCFWIALFDWQKISTRKYIKCWSFPFPFCNSRLCLCKCEKEITHTI